MPPEMPPAVLAFLRERGAADIPHPGGTLLEHLVRTAQAVAQWEAPGDVIMAALCHATYGTDGFGPSLLPAEERGPLQALIGPLAEQIAYRYCASDRAVTWPQVGDAGPVAYRDRFTGDVGSLSPDEVCQYWTITVANELDLIDRLPNGRQILPTLKAGIGLLPPAGALRLSQLG